MRMAAVFHGTLAVVDGYLVLAYFSDDPPVIPLFPYGSATWDDASGTLTYEGVPYRVGDEIMLGGGAVDRDSYPLGDKHSVPSCDIDRLFLAG